MRNNQMANCSCYAEIDRMINEGGVGAETSHSLDAKRSLEPKENRRNRVGFNSTYLPQKEGRDEL